MALASCKCVTTKCRQADCACYGRGVPCSDDCMCIDCQNTERRAAPANGARDRGDDDGGEEGDAAAAPPGFRCVPAAPAVPAPGLKGLDLAKLKPGEGCACPNSKCLKRYCVCFNAGVGCEVGRCTCSDCHNPHGAVSSVARGAALAERRAKALVGRAAADGALFVPRAAAAARCACSRTGCLKLYCACFRQDRACTDACTCLGCRNCVGEDGPAGARTRAREEILRTRPHVFRTPKKRTGDGCSCQKNKCSTLYCDCNARGVGCDPAICTCINCSNMMKPLSEMQDEPEPVNEDTTEVFVHNEAPDLDTGTIKGLPNFSHLIDNVAEADEQRITNPSEKMNLAYVATDAAAAATKKVVDAEAEVCRELEKKIQTLEARLEEDVAQETVAREDYLQKTNRVMCLEMEEPCRWNHTYKRLKEYVMRTGDLPPVPSACTAEGDRKLSIWVQEMKSLVYSKSERITAAPHRIEALEALGIEWTESGEAKWNRMYARLLAYKRQHNTVLLPTFMQCRRAKDKQLGDLRWWVDLQGQEVRSGAMARRRDRLKRLQALGLPLELSWEQEWGHRVVELLKFRSKYGHADVFGGAHPDLADFVSQVTDRLKKGSPVKLTKVELADLREKGLLGEFKGKSARPLQGGAPADTARLVPLERVKEVNYWAGMLKQLKVYKKEHGTLSFTNAKKSGRRGGPQYAHLYDWIEVQRESYENRTLEQSRIDELRKLGLEFDPWDHMFNKLKKFKREGGTVRLPKEWKADSGDGKMDEELAELCKWLQEHIRLYRKGELESEKKKKLRQLGVYLTKGHMGKMLWEDRLEEMMEFYHANKTCLPARDGPLRQWVLELVDLIQNGYVSQKRQKLLDEERIGPYLRPEVLFKQEPPGSKKRKAPPPSVGVAEADKKAKVDATAI